MLKSLNAGIESFEQLIHVVLCRAEVLLSSVRRRRLCLKYGRLLNLLLVLIFLTILLIHIRGKVLLHVVWHAALRVKRFFKTSLLLERVFIFGLIFGKLGLRVMVLFIGVPLIPRLLLLLYSGFVSILPGKVLVLDGGEVLISLVECYAFTAHFRLSERLFGISAGEGYLETSGRDIGWLFELIVVSFQSLFLITSMVCIRHGPTPLDEIRRPLCW